MTAAEKLPNGLNVNGNFIQQAIVTGICLLGGLIILLVSVITH